MCSYSQHDNFRGVLSKERFNLSSLFVEGIHYHILGGALIRKKKALRKIFYERCFMLVDENIH